MGAKKALLWLDLGKTSYKHLVFARNDFLRLVEPPNESLRLDFGKTSYKDFVFPLGEFLRFFGAPNVSLRLIII